MSYLAIGAVTKAIAELLARKMNKPPLLGAVVPKVTTLPPDDDRVSVTDGVNLFLYHVETNPFFNNMDWRGDKTNPQGSKRPPVALSLHYLLTAYAKKGDSTAQDDITAHQLLGNAMAILHEYPILNDVHDSDFDANEDAQFAPELRNSFEKVKITQAPTTVEEFSKIWTGLSKAYRLSVVYDVSLVQIAPIAPTELPAPPVQEIGLLTTTRGAPLVESVTPATVAAGSTLVVKGHDLKTANSSTVVRLDELMLDETALLKCTPEEIALIVPDALTRGPRVSLSVISGGQESAPVSFEVRPWIDAIRPLRGLTGVPLVIPYEVPAATTVAVEIDGKSAPAVYDADAKLVRTTVPETITSNGLKPVVLLVGSPAAARSNARLYEVMPLIQSVNVTTKANPAQTTITVNGQRLNGKDVHVRYGDLLIRKGENVNPAQVVVTMPRILATNLAASVLVDNRESNRLPPLLESVEPLKATRGASITLRGLGLSGKTVAVKFGATAVNVGAHAYATQLTVAVPQNLPFGDVQVRVTVNGTDSNALTLKVLS
ncbi:MAG TPA: Pvc16 family protein [Pyrinomonadaceae bacterium]|nr:Pvc16 family protein [Pyrinomonadaceae bacterium]